MAGHQPQRRSFLHATLSAACGVSQPHAIQKFTLETTQWFATTPEDYALAAQFPQCDADAAPEPTRYTCPWCATEEFRYQLPGDVLWVARGHHAKDVKPQ